MSTADELVRPDRLGPALVAALSDERWRRPRAELISGGKSNLTFRLTGGAGTLILRRPPSGQLQPKAHDMAREVRIQRALAGTPVPVPPIVLADLDGELLGVPSYVMREVAGHVLRDAMPPGYADDPRERVAIADALVDVLADLHGLDPGTVRPGGPDRTADFFARQVAVWQRQWERTSTGAVPAVDALLRELNRRPPAPGRAAILHGDYRLDNCLLDPHDPGRVAAVLDWELSTIGDPLADLGMLLFYWARPEDARPLLTPALTAAPGFPPRRHLVERYVARTGADTADLLTWRAYAHFKFAVIAQGVWSRSIAGQMADQHFGDLSAEVVRIAETGLELLEKGA